MDRRRRDRLVLGSARAAIGLGMIGAPTQVLGVLGTDRVTASKISWATRMLGAREVALGAGLAATARRPGAAAAWVWAGLACDALDLVVLSDAVRRRTVRRSTGLPSVALAAAGMACGVRSLGGS